MAPSTPGPTPCWPSNGRAIARTDINCADLFETITFPGFWKLARKYYRDGLMEMVRSVSKRLFVKSLQQLVPEVTEDDLVPTHSGVRAQALMPDGKLVDDFLIVKGKNSIHVCNAPSPAATASLEIGRFIANQLPEVTLARRSRSLEVRYPASRSGLMLERRQIRSSFILPTNKFVE